ncbi:MAG: hypothetical protein OXH50_16945 [Gemmatimonadetes bacterium]|nr:hypothetical protein [Gemmatimonadota bacterium]
MSSKKGYRWLWIGATVLLSGPVQAQKEFPIGVWFPGMLEDDDAQRAARLDSVQAAGFNTIHAMRGPGQLRSSEYNQAWMALAHARGLKVELHSWLQPPEWRESSRTYWARTFEAEDTNLFTYPTGREADA